MWNWITEDEKLGASNRSIKMNRERALDMKIVVFENGSKMKLIAVVVADNGDEHELVRTEKGRDDLLNQIHAMHLSYLTVEFK